MGAPQEDPNLLRILISTDNHLGVWEKDEVRRDDSFTTFEEVLRLAVQLRADAVLLGGDLFHENKPSRATLVKAIGLLSKYCLNDAPVRFRVLSDQRTNFVAGRVNFESEHLNVGLPVFTIHGNHDDPAGQDSLSAVDILSEAGLVNYFGKHMLTGTGAARITLSPVLLQKGDTRLCLYGLGNIRDERLGRAFQTPGCVQWQRPAATPEHPSDAWLNVFVLHQNRVAHGPLAKACVREEQLPDFLDLAVWGHEHECRPDPEVLRGDAAGGGGRYVVQPGSSVATALSEGESKPKHAVLFEARGPQFRLTKYRLRTVRPFVFDSVALREAKPPLAPEDQEAVARYLVDRVESLIARAVADFPPPPGPDSGPGTPMLPLIRLRVDYTGFSTVNSQRLGQRFVGKVANPHDMLLWTKAAARRAKGEGEGGAAEDPTEAAAGAYGAGGFLRPEALDQARIEDLIRQHLGAGALEVLPDEELGVALHAFVEKDDKNALSACIEAALEETRQAALAQQMEGLGVGPRGGDAAKGEEDGEDMELGAGGGGGAGGRGGKGRGGATGSPGDDEAALARAVRAGAEARMKARRERAAAGEPDLLSSLPAPSLDGGDDRGAGAMQGGAYGGVYDEPSRTAGGSAAGPSQATTGRGRGRGSRGGKARGAAAAAAGGPMDMFLRPAARGAAATPAKGRGGRAAGGRGRGRAAAARSDSDEEMADARGPGSRGGSDDDGIEDDDEDGGFGTGPRGRAGAAAAAKGRGRGAAAAKKGAAAAAAAAPGSAQRRPSKRTAAAGKKRYRVDSEDEAGASDADSDFSGEKLAAEAARGGVADDDDDVVLDSEDDGIEDSPPPHSAATASAAAGGSRGRGRGAAAGGLGAGSARAGGVGRGRGKTASLTGSAAARQAQPAPGSRAPDVTLISSSDDEDGGGTIGAGPGPAAAQARVHAAAGAALGLAGPTSMTATTQQPGATGSTQGGSGTQAGGRKRPASFFGVGAGVGAGAAGTQRGAGRGRGQPR